MQSDKSFSLAHTYSRSHHAAYLSFVLVAPVSSLNLSRNEPSLGKPCELFGREKTCCIRAFISQLSR